MQYRETSPEDGIHNRGLDTFMSTGAYVALGCQVGLHGHGMLDHELGPDLAEQVEGGDASHLPCRVHPLALYGGMHSTLNRSKNHHSVCTMLDHTLTCYNTALILYWQTMEHTCQGFLIFEDVLHQIVHELNASLFGRFVSGVLFSFEQLKRGQKLSLKKQLSRFCP